MNRLIDPEIQGEERQKMRTVLSTLGAGYRNDVIVISQGKTYSNRNYLKDEQFTFPRLSQAQLSNPSVVDLTSPEHYEATSSSPVPQYYDSIGLSAQSVPNLDHIATCNENPSGPNYANVLKPGNELASLGQMQGTTGDRLTGEITSSNQPVTLTNAKYIKATVWMPAITQDNLTLDRENGCTNPGGDLQETANPYIGTFYEGAQPVEGVLRFNCGGEGSFVEDGWTMAIQPDPRPRGVADNFGGFNLQNIDQEIEMEFYVKEGDNTDPDGDGPLINNQVVFAVTANFDFYGLIKSCAERPAGTCEELQGNLAGKQRILLIVDDFPGTELLNRADNPLSPLDPSDPASVDNVMYAMFGIAQATADDPNTPDKNESVPTFEPDSGAKWSGAELRKLEVANCWDWADARCARVNWNPYDASFAMNYGDNPPCANLDDSKIQVKDGNNNTPPQSLPVSIDFDLDSEPIGGSITDFYSDQLSFTARISPTNPDAKYDVQWIGFTNGGPGTLRYDITENIPWLEVLGPTSDTLPEGEEAGIQIRATCTELGNFDGSLTVEGAGQTFTVQVTLECTESIYIYSLSADKSVIGYGDNIYLDLQTSGDPTGKVIWSTKSTSGRVQEESDGTFVYQISDGSPSFLSQNVLTVTNIDDPTNTFSVNITECPGFVDEDAWYCPIKVFTSTVRNPVLTDNHEIYQANDQTDSVSIWTQGTSYGFDINLNMDEPFVYPNNKGQFLVYDQGNPGTVHVYQRTNARIRLINSWINQTPSGLSPRPIGFNDLGEMIAISYQDNGHIFRWRNGVYEEYGGRSPDTGNYWFEDFSNNVGDFFFGVDECDEDNNCSLFGSVIWKANGEDIFLPIPNAYARMINDNLDYLVDAPDTTVYSSIHGTVCQGQDCEAVGITNAGDVLLSTKDSAGKYQSYIWLWDRTSHLNLQDLLDLDFPDTLRLSYAINNKGSILVSSSSGTKYLLVPMPGNPVYRN